MDMVQARLYVRSLCGEYVQSKGYDLKRPFSCLNPEHTDRNPSMRYDVRRNKVHCFSCGVDYDTFDLIALEYSLTDSSAIFRKAYELFQVDFGRDRFLATSKKLSGETYIAFCCSQLDKTDYWKKRGLSLAVCQRFSVGFDPMFQTADQFWEALIVPTGPDSFTVRNTADAAKTDRLRKIGSAVPFHLEAVYQDRPVFVTEGELDALSVMEAGGEAMALGSAVGVNRFLKICKGKYPKAPLILALDQDVSGKKAEAELAQGLEQLGICYRIAVCPKKDPNEFLCSDREGFFQWIREEEDSFSFCKDAEAVSVVSQPVYPENSAASYLQEFQELIREGNATRKNTTGFKRLDGLLDGGLCAGLYTLGAVSGVGKTTLVLQLADQIARKQDVLFFSLEMSRRELLSKSLSRLTFLSDSNKAATMQEVLSGNTRQKEIDQAMQVYFSYGKHLFFQEGTGSTTAKQVREAVEQHKKQQGTAPVVIVDYLQMLAPISTRVSDKQSTDWNVAELKRISRDFQIPVIAVSSFNRQSYSQRAGLDAFKESGSIEYGSDVLFALQPKGVGEPGFDLEKEQKKSPRELELRILKNRNGPAGASLWFSYYPQYHCFLEQNSSDGRGLESKRKNRL